MTGPVAGLTTALSALDANSRFFRNTSNNIANVNTDTFQTEQTRFSATEPSGTRATTLVDPGLSSFLQTEDAPEDTPSDVDLARELPNLVIGSNAYEAAIRVAQVADELLEETIDITS